jgi:hypothetical protein
MLFLTIFKLFYVQDALDQRRRASARSKEIHVPSGIQDILLHFQFGQSRDGRAIKREIQYEIQGILALFGK